MSKYSLVNTRYPAMGSVKNPSLGRQRKSNAQRTASSLACLKDDFEGKISTGIKPEVDA